MSIRVREKTLKTGETKIQLLGAGPFICLTVAETKQLILDLREHLEVIEDWSKIETPPGRITWPHMGQTVNKILGVEESQ